jgi:uncharacterized membrane protein (DUF485 family)
MQQINSNAKEKLKAKRKAFCILLEYMALGFLICTLFLIAHKINYMNKVVGREIILSSIAE